MLFGQSRPLISGEFEYWRHNSLHWERIIDLMVDAGLDTVATFVCWEHHEYERGRFDFIGETHPSRGLAPWLDLCHRKGLKVLLRLGPIIDAEWPSRGPAWDVCARERLDPVFQARSAEYLAALATVVVPRQATAGGPVIALCLDNEVYFPYTMAAAPGHPEIPYDEATVLAKYREWLRAKYGSIDALNAAWQSSLEDWDSIRTPNYQAESRVQILDSFEFITYAIRTFFDWLQTTCRTLGMTLPTFTNMKQFTEYIDWHEIEQVLDSQGLNTYFGNCLPDRQGVLAQWYYRVHQTRVRFFWAPEFSSGAPIPSKYSNLGPDHFRYFNQLSMALGLRGANWFMFVERDDWHYSPINNVGKIRPQYEVMKDNIRIWRQLRHDKQVADIGLLWFLPHHQSFVSEKVQSWTEVAMYVRQTEQPLEYPNWWSTFESLLDLDVDFAIANPGVPDGLARPYLIYAGPDYAPADLWSKVADRIDEGAHLIAASPLPTHGVLPSDHSRMSAISKRIRASARYHECTPMEAGSVAIVNGAEQYATSRPGGMWSTARLSDEGWTISVINPSERRANALVELGSAVVSGDSSYQIRALVANETRQLSGKEARRLATSLGPKSVEIYLIHRVNSG